MRIPKSWVPLISRKILGDLLKKGVVVASVPMDVLTLETERLITDELMVEDRINDEVKEMLKKYSSEIEKGRLDFKKVFDLTKKKLVQERGIVI
jgi:hypothetical protein